MRPIPFDASKDLAPIPFDERLLRIDSDHPQAVAGSGRTGEKVPPGSGGLASPREIQRAVRPCLGVAAVGRHRKNAVFDIL